MGGRSCVLPEQKPKVDSLLSSFSLANSSQQIAFLRLLGLRNLSITTLRERGIAGCYIDGLDKLQEPRITISHHIVLHSLVEYVNVNLMYIDLPINRHNLSRDQYTDVMGIVDNFDENDIKNLYYELSTLTDEDVDFITSTLFTTNISKSCASTFREHLNRAREFCQNYVTEQMGVPRSPSA